MVQGVVSLSSPLEAVQHVIDVAYNAYNTRMVTVSDGDCISISEKGSADGPLWKEPTASWRSSVGPLLKVRAVFHNLPGLSRQGKGPTTLFPDSHLSIFSFKSADYQRACWLLILLLHNFHGVVPFCC